MKSNIPWSVKGIDPEAREAAKIAARRAGMTLGEWLNSLILQSGELPEGLAAQLAAEAAAEDARHGSSLGSALDSDPDEDLEDVTDLQSRLENLNRRLDASERQSALAVSGIDQSIERLASTIESSRRLLTSGEVAPKVNDLSARVEQLQSQIEHIAAQSRTGLDSRTLMALEKAIAGVAGHIEKSDRRNADLVQSVEEAISELSAKVGHAEAQASEAIGRIDLTMDRVGSRIDATEAEQRRSSARLNERLAQLDERLATTLVQREAGIGGVERRLGGLETRIENMQGQIKAQLDEVRARPLMPPEAFSRKEFEDWSRRTAADQGASQATARQSLANLEARIAVLAERAERIQREGGGQASAAAERIAENARSSAERADAAAKRMLESSDSLKTDVAALGDRLERTNHTATETMSALEGVLRQLTRRLDAIESRAATKVEAAPPEPVYTPPEPVVPEPPRAAAARAAPAAPAAERKVPSKSPGWLWREDPKAPAVPEPLHESAAEEEHHAADEVVEVFDTSSPVETYTEELESAPADETYSRDERTEERGGRGFDLSNLNFSLGNARDHHAEEETPLEEEPAPYIEHDPLEARDPYQARESHDDVDHAAPSAEDNSWLEQARRAAKAAGPADQAYDYDGGKSGNKNRIYWIAAAVLAIAAVLLLLWRVVPPMFKKHDASISTTQTTPSGERAPISPSTAPNQKPSTTQGHNAPPLAGNSATNSPDSVLAPREGDVGPLVPKSTDVAPPVTAPPANTATPPASTVKLTPEEALKAAADAGKPQAQYAYALGLKAKGNTDQAIENMKRAASKGLAVAERQLGIWYEQGDGIGKDIKEAGQHYLAAAKGGDVQAMHNLGFFFAQGMGDLPKSGATAEHWFKSAAERGLVASQVNLAIVYSQADAFGLPAPSDPQAYANDAYFWAALAAARGDDQAERMRAAIGKDMNAAVKADLDKKVGSWKPQMLDVTANGGFDTNPEAFLPADQQPPLNKDEIISIQEMLNNLGFKVGTADGKLGPSLEKAIKSFQAAYHLPETGVADHNLIAALDVIPR